MYQLLGYKKRFIKKVNVNVIKFKVRRAKKATIRELESLVDPLVDQRKKRATSFRGSCSSIEKMYPYQRNQVHYAPMYYPTVPPQVKIDQPRQPAAYESWPWDGSHGYHYPVQCHGCCNHNYSPGYLMMRPPYPHVPPPYFHGYPAAPGAYPFSYFPPHYAMEVPHYEFNKDTPGEHHCCGCPNHPHGRKEGKSIKIEEVEPDQAETKWNQSLFPWQFKDYPYPIIWLPPGYMKSKEERGPDDLEHEAQDRSWRGAKANGNLRSFEEQPTAWNGWFPFDPSKLGSLKQGEDHKRIRHNRDEKALDNSKSFEVQPSFWSGWFPYEASNPGSSKHGEDHGKSHHYPDEKGHENKSFEEQPMGNGWFPFDFNKIQPVKQGEDHRGSRYNQDNKQGSFPFPVLWMPYKPEITTEGEEPKETFIKQGPPSQFESTTEKLDKTEAKCEGDIKDDGAKLVGKDAVQKTIPVKQMESNQEKRTSESIGEKNGANSIQKTIPVKQVERNEEKETSERIVEKNGAKKLHEEGARRQSSSPQKSSKLPPVCLRLEPLPMKKGTNGHSRSPSPNGDKGKSNDSSGKLSVPTKSPTAKECAKQNVPATDSNDVRSTVQEQNKNEVKSIHVYEGTIQEGIGKLESAHAHSSSAEETTAQMQKNLNEGDGDKKKSSEGYSLRDKATTVVQSNGARGISGPKGTFASNTERARRITLSEAEAAVVIQSAFRGFEVRKSDPLKKLKQIAKIKEQIGDMRNRIQALESSSETCNNDKQRAIITEMIMSLLLKLDTIQGVHPSIRDIRKSVAKELVSLQETLDLLISKNLLKSLEQLSGTSSEENISEEIKEDLGTERENQGDDIGHECNILTSEQETESLSVEPCHEQPHCVTDVASDAKDAEISESTVVTENLDEEIKNLLTIGPETGVEPVMGLEAGDNKKEIDDSSVTEAPYDHGGFKQPFESQKVGGGSTNATETTDSTLADRNKDGEEIAESQQGALHVCIDSELFNEEEKIEPRVNEVSENKVANYISVVPEHGEVKDLNRTAQLQEGRKEPVMSGLEDKLGDEEEEIPIAEVLGQTLPVLHEIPVEVQGEENGTDAPVEFPEAETEVGFGNAAEALKVEGANASGCSKLINEVEVSNIGEPAEASKLEETTTDMEFPKAETEVGLQSAAEALKVEGADSSGCSNPTNEEEVSNFEEPAEASKLEKPATAEALGELSSGSNEVQDESHDHEAINSNFLLGSEDTKAVSATCEASVELSKEHEAEGDKNYVEEGLEGQDINPVAGDGEKTGDHIGHVESEREVSVPAIARTVEEVDVESTIANNEEVAAQSCGSATAEHEDFERLESVHTNIKGGHEGGFSPPSPTASQVSHLSDTVTESGSRLIEENEKLREMMEKLIEAGNKQLTTISSLSGRIKDLEKRLNRKKKLKIKPPRTSTSGSSCLKTKNGSLEERPLGLAM